MNFKSTNFLLIGALFYYFSIQITTAQVSIGGKPYSFVQRMSSKDLVSVKMPQIDISKLEAEDIKDEVNGVPPRFGEPLKVDLNMDNSGHWESLPNGGRLWRLSIEAPGAKSINLLYNDFYLPKGAVLYIYSADQKQVIGGFSAANNKSDRIFATGLVYGDRIVLEYYESPETVAKMRDPESTDKASISINYVVHGYRYINFDEKALRAFGSSGSCNVNTVCPQGDNWRNEIKSVAMLLISGFRFCTGYLVNNTAQDCRPLLLTANHCLGTSDAISSPSVNTWTFMWRYESPTCTPNADGPTSMTTNGGTVLANPGSPGSIVSSDFALIEMAENPKTAGYDVYFAGFDATSTAPGSATGIHHPRGDVKKISMENAALTGTTYGGSGGTASHWRVFDWDSGTTEPGSSGSPIFSNATKRAMGFLSGGGAACGNDLQDWYGSLGYSWNNNGATDSRRRLRDHLDPGGLATFVDGSTNPCVVTPPVGPANDLCANATPIVTNGGNICGTTINAGADNPNGGLTCGTDADAEGDGVWYTFTGDGQTWNFLFPEASGWDPEVNVYSGSCGTLVCEGGDNDSGPGFDAQFSIPTVLGTTYYVYVHSALSAETSDFCFTANSEMCPTFSGAPGNVNITNSTCTSACSPSGGMISAPVGTPCPIGSTIQYSTDAGTSWSGALPIYSQSGPVQTIITRCSCTLTPTIVSSSSAPVATVPGTCSIPTAGITVAETHGTANDGISCAGANVLLTGTGGSSYAWSTGTTTNPVNVAPVSATTYTVTVTSVNGCTNTATTTINIDPLPCGWSADPNGVNCANGNSFSHNFNTQVFTGTSTNCYYPNSFTSDALAFAQYDLCGNGSITAQVTSITPLGQGWAGVTMRESNAAGAKKAQLMTNLSNLSRREFRTTTNGQAYPQQFPSQNRYWLRITRTGNQFVMYISPNGTTWYPAGVQTIMMSTCIEIGLVVTNYNPNSTVTATFANVSVTGSNPVRPATIIQEDELAVADFSIVPNPTNGLIEIDLSSYSQRKVQMELYNLQGKLLRSINIESVKGKEEIDLTSFANGIYLIRMRAEGIPDVTKRVVVNRNE